MFNCNGAYHPALKVEPDERYNEFYSPPSRELAEACEQAYAEGMLMVFPAGGNCGPRNTISYPACYEQVIQAGPCNMHGEPSNFAQVSPTVEVLSPGGQRSAAAPEIGGGMEGVFSLADNGGYASMSGGCTSTPHVSGVLALILSKNPNWTVEEARMILRNTACGIGWSERTGHGVINARRALQVDSVDVQLKISHVMGWRCGWTAGIRRDLSSLPVHEAAEIKGVPVTIQAVVRNTGVRDLEKALILFFAGDPQQGGQMIAVRKFSVYGLESITFEVDSVVAPDCREIYTLVDPLGAQEFCDRPYLTARGKISGR